MKTFKPYVIETLNVGNVCVLANEGSSDKEIIDIAESLNLYTKEQISEMKLSEIYNISFKEAREEYDINVSKLLNLDNYHLDINSDNVNIYYDDCKNEKEYLVGWSSDEWNEDTDVLETVFLMIKNFTEDKLDILEVLNILHPSFK